MNEKNIIIKLRSFMLRDDGWGSDEGMDVAKELLKKVEENISKVIFQISLDGIDKNDASFARESVIAVAKRYRGVKGFFLTDLESIDILDNWVAGANLLEQPINVSIDGKLKIIGPAVSPSNKLILDYINQNLEVTASELSKKLDLKLTNASTKLNKLREQGYILREEIAASSGGKEFNYISIS